MDLVWLYKKVFIDVNYSRLTAVVGIELLDKKDLAPLVARMKERNFYGEYLNDKPNLFEFLV